MKKQSIFLVAILSILTSCVVASPNSSSQNNQNSAPSSTSSEIVVKDDGTITEEDKAYPVVNDEFDYNDMLDGEFDIDKWYRNDLKALTMPDPFVLTVEEDNGDEIYYVFGTTDRYGSKHFDCHETTNFNEFTVHSVIDDQNPNLWYQGSDLSKYAPEVYEIDGTYYLYYSAVNKNNGLRYISVMTSDNPAGPYVENIANRPTFDHVTNTNINLSVLDQTIFIDDDGSMYMYYSVYDSGIMQYIVGVELTSPTVADWSTYKILARPGKQRPNDSKKLLTWEDMNASGFAVNEGPFMLKAPDGYYYLTYSVNHYPDKFYTVCYALSDSPLGDFVKPYTNGGTWTNVFFGYAGDKTGTVHSQWSGFMSGTAHHCFFKSGDQYMIGYHAHKNRTGGTVNDARLFAMDYVFFSEDGTPFTRGPTYSIQPLPGKISGFENIAPYAKMNVDGVINANRLVDDFVVEHYNLPQEQNKEATLPAGKSYIEFVFSNNYLIGGIAIYNSAFYNKAMHDDISFINMMNGNAIINGSFNSMDYVNDDKEFIFPGSAYTFDFAEVETNRIVIEFDVEHEVNLNEIVILGYM